jgi:hypothetical protein
MSKKVDKIDKFEKFSEKANKASEAVLNLSKAILHMAVASTFVYSSMHLHHMLSITKAAQSVAEQLRGYEQALKFNHE